PQAPARHRACPDAAPYGQLVRASDGRRLVRCVTAPDQLLPASGRAVPLDPEAPVAPPSEPAPAPVPVAAPAPAIAETAPEPAAAQVAATVAGPAPGPLLVIDSRVAGQPFPDSSGAFVQVATFAVPENATRTRAALNAQRLPVRSQPARLRGQPVQVILTGPFLTEADLHRALGAVRAMGFRDAFVRG
ncbi:MAG: SPOR domain-containing protein, partial [Rhodobacteraceae bacterium]|nr:SPOR domain-containing protein [Paracoccaceae bacterium]